MTPDEITKREKRSAPEPIQLPTPPPTPTPVPTPAEPITVPR